MLLAPPPCDLVPHCAYIWSRLGPHQTLAWNCSPGGTEASTEVVTLFCNTLLRFDDWSLTVRIALVGPVHVDPLLPWLDIEGRPYPAGTPRGATPLTQLARGFLAADHDLLVVSLDPDVDQEVILRGPNLTIRIGPLRTRGRTRDFNRQERLFIATTLRQERPSVAHAQWTYEFALGALASGVPTVVTVRDWAPTIFCLQPSPYRAVRLAMSLATFIKGRHFTVTSPYMLEKVKRWRLGTTSLIPNAVYDGLFEPYHNRPVGDTTSFLAVNNGFGKRKNVRCLLKAYAQVRRELPGTQLRLLGYDFEVGGPAEEWAKSNGLDAGVVFLGERSNTDVHAEMRSAAVFVHPAVEESFGLVLVEAMALSLPVVAGRKSGAVPWVSDGGRAALLVDVTDADSLAVGMLESVRDRAASWDRAASGHAYSREHFRVTAVVNDYLELYKRVREIA